MSDSRRADAYLREHPNPILRQYRSPRRVDPSGVVAVHTAENAPDFVAFDGGAEAVADWISRRDTPGSYHDLVDSDSALNLVRYDDEAWHDGTGTNPHSYGLSIATRADVWPLAPAAWRAGAIEQAAQAAARYARWLYARRGIVIPARRITAAQARARVPGFVTHGELDPGRRSDPGAGFPWATFLARYAQLTRDLTTNPEGDWLAMATPEELDAAVEKAVTAALAPLIKQINYVGGLVMIGAAETFDKLGNLRGWSATSAEAATASAIKLGLDRAEIKRAAGQARARAIELDTSPSKKN